MSISQEQERIRRFLEDRPRMKENNSDPEQIIKLLRGEVDEAEEVLGDPEKLGRELVDVVWFALSMAELNGIDLAAEFAEKHARNELKYPAHLFNNGRTYAEAHKLAKELWKGEKGEDWFYSIGEEQDNVS